MNSGSGWSPFTQTFIRPESLTRQPFTRQPIKITSARKLIDVTSNGKTIGALRWTIDDSGIEVYGNENVMRPIAERIASEFGATYTPT